MTSARRITTLPEKDKGFVMQESVSLSHEILPKRLRKVCDPQTLQCLTSQELEASKAIIGQDRAARALQFGLGITGMGFNIYVSGFPGTGRTTMVERLLEQVARDRPLPADWCYVNNFHELSRPMALRLPPGRARPFQSDMRTLVDGARREVRKAFESEDYVAKRKAIASALEQQADVALAQVNDKAREAGFQVQVGPIGIAILPVHSKKGRPLTEDEFMALAPAEQAAIGEKQRDLQAEIEAALRHAKALSRGAHTELERMDRQVGLFAIGHLLDELKDKYHDLPEILGYLDAMRDDVLDRLDQFRAEGQEQPALPFPVPPAGEQLFRRYAVNVLVDNSGLQGAPVVMELNPTCANLFGRMENEAQFGALVTDFTLIRPGSLHRANGGYLVLPVEDVLRNNFAWDSLKRALRNQAIVIEDLTERLGLPTTRRLQPQPIPLGVKVILVGRPDLYQLLQALDEDFSELFKVKAEFDSVMDRTEESIRDYGRFVSAVCSADGLRHLENGALAKLVEHGSRLSEDQTKLSTRFGEIADVMREADYYAAGEGGAYVTAAHIQKAIDEKFYRSSRVRERLQELTARGTLRIDVEGQKVGQVNGLSVLDLGDIAFGHPNRITASLGVGREGVVDIEREAKLGGSTHTKGVLILAGYLLDKYAQDKPLSLSARLVFEQSYSGVEGDSASSTELYALLSALAGLPIRQGIAVTGSVDQKGDVQAIGGVNEKVEGFFEVCRAQGLNGNQGVLIPASNEWNLMLREDVIEAVRGGKFHLWSVQTIDEGIEILTGVKAGARNGDGSFEAGSVNDRVDKRLQALAETLVRFGRDSDEVKVVAEHSL